jgi:anti-anti-sigma factor
MSKEFAISPHETDGRLTKIRVLGRLDAEAAQELRNYCDKLRNQGHRNLALDMSDITFVASSGLGTLLALTEEFGETGGCLYLAPVSEAVLSVVKLLNLDKFLAIYESIDDVAVMAK